MASKARQLGSAISTGGALSSSSSSSPMIPVHTTALRPATPSEGTMGINSTTSRLEIYYSGLWNTVSSLGLGMSSLTPALSATALQVAGYTTNGNYWITIADTPVECYVNFTFAGGPYILAMVTSGTGDTYGYDSTVWTDATGGISTALDPAASSNQVHMSFYNLVTTRTGLALHQNSTSYFQYTDHSSYTARNLATGSAGALTATAPSNTDILANSIVVNGAAGRPDGWGDAITAAGFSAMNWGGTYYRYGWQHGTPDPAQFGYARFGWTADQDSSDSRDRVIGVGIKNASGGPVGTVSYSAGFTDYTASTSNTLKAFLYIKN